MCWAHVFRNIRPKLAAIRKANPALGASMLADVESIQWMVQSEAEFEDVCEKYKRHYLQQELTDVERKLVMDFVEYFLAQWGPGSHASNWYAGAHPFSLTNNQVESDLQRIFGELFFHFFSQPGYGRQPQGNKGQPHVPDRASAWPIHPSTRAAGKYLSSLLEPQINNYHFPFFVCPSSCMRCQMFGQITCNWRYFFTFHALNQVWGCLTHFHFPFFVCPSSSMHFQMFGQIT